MRLDSRAYDDRDMRARRTVARIRVDTAEILERAAQRRARAVRIRIACELGAGLAAWALASFLWGQAGFFGAGLALVAAVLFTVALQAVEGGRR